jgi:transcriptional regulator with XRE-family HTH domain
MAAKSFQSLFEEAKQHEDYWVEQAILEVTEEVARRMEELEVSRAELARRLGTSPAYVTKILRGDANFTLATIVKLTRALKSELRFHLARPGSLTHWKDDVSWAGNGGHEYSAVLRTRGRRKGADRTPRTEPVGRMTTSKTPGSSKPGSPERYDEPAPIAA